jgi:hypothetical protein
MKNPLYRSKSYYIFQVKIWRKFASERNPGSHAMIQAAKAVFLRFGGALTFDPLRA